MTKIISSPNCGDSPKMEFIKQFNIAFADAFTYTSSLERQNDGFLLYCPQRQTVGLSRQF